MKRRKDLTGSITMPDGRVCSVVFRPHSGSGPAGVLEIKDPSDVLVYGSSANSQSDAVFDFYVWLLDHRE